MRVDENGDLDLSDRELEYVHKGVLFLTIVAGVAIVLLGVVGAERYSWHAVYVSICVNVGTAVALVVVLLAIERRLVQRLRAAVLEPPMCPLAQPPTRINLRSVMASDDPNDTNSPYGCSHDPEHRWDPVTGKRLADHLRTKPL
jgi:hypothetical protein